MRHVDYYMLQANWRLLCYPNYQSEYVWKRWHKIIEISMLNDLTGQRDTMLYDSMRRQWWIDQINSVEVFARNARVMRGRFLALSRYASVPRRVEIAQNWILALFNAFSSSMATFCFFNQNVFICLIFTKAPRLDLSRCIALQRNGNVQ